MRFLTKKLYFLALLVAALSWSGNAFAQEKNDSSGSWYEEELQEEPKVSRKVLRKQMLADQRTLSVMYEQATGEFAARPTVRFPDYMAYRPSLPHTYYATPFRWNRPYSYRWY